MKKPNVFESNAIEQFSKFYPQTVAAMGGVQGLEKYLVGHENMTMEQSRVFRAENTRLLDEFGEGEPGSQFYEVGRSNVMKEICSGVV